jgi:hypothetical protein
MRTDATGEVDRSQVDIGVMMCRMPSGASSGRMTQTYGVREQNSETEAAVVTLGLYNCIWEVLGLNRPPLWSSSQSFWLLTQRSRVRFPALSDFLSSSGSGTGSTQPL